LPTFGQCCGSGSGIRCSFDPWIRVEIFPDLGFQNQCCWELSNMVKKIKNIWIVC